MGQLISSSNKKPEGVGLFPRILLCVDVKRTGAICWLHEPVHGKLSISTLSQMSHTTASPLGLPTR